MNHHITETDRVFSTRVPMWHGLGEVWSEYPTIEEARERVLNWEPIPEPIYRKTPIITETGELTEVYTEVWGSKLVTRSDNAVELGVVNSGFELVKNAEMFDIIDALEAGNRGNAPIKLETGGSLKGGRKVFLLARLEEPIKVTGDPNGDTIQYYALQNSHDGSGAFRGQALNTRIVCDNTSRWADFEAKRRGTEFVFRHTKNIKDRIEEAQTALAGWRESINAWSEMVEVLVKTPVTEEQRKDFIELFIPMPKSETLITDRVRNNVLTARGSMQELFESKTLEGISHTAYGLVQAGIEWGQHVRATKGKTDRERLENRFSRAYLDNSELNQTAVKLVKMLVNV